jgi:murein DD-endopeptidase MepM/ murein hydrolase activator NlpD
MIDQIIAAIGEDNIKSTAEVEKVRRDYNKSITMVSDSLTGLTDAFYDILTSRTNVANINRAVLKARESQSRENMLESGALASIVPQPVSQETTFNFDDLTSAINELNAAIDQYGLGGDDGLGIDDVAEGGRRRRGRRGRRRRMLGLAGGMAIAGGLGLAATQAKASPSLNTNIAGDAGGALPTVPSQPLAVSRGPVSVNQQGIRSPNIFPGLGVSSTGTGTSVVEAGPGYTVIQYTNGKVERRVGARNWRNNNPGNIEFGSYARSKGAIGTDGRFAVFPTYEAGLAAKESLLFEGRNYRNLTITAAISRYAPQFENDTNSYINQVASAVGVSPYTKLNELSSSQRRAMLGAMERVEGFKVGRVEVLTSGTATSQSISSSFVPVPSETQADGTRLVGSGAFIHPTANERITSRFGPRRRPTAGASSNHKGVDFGPVKPGTKGDPIYASAEGTVTFAGNARGYGTVIYVDHADGYQTRYAHLDRVLVRNGQRVTQGQQIGQLGNTGVGTGPHLHFEIRKGGQAVNPLSLLSGGTVVPDPDATEPANVDSGRNPGSATDTGSLRPESTLSSQVAAPAAEIAIQKKAQEEGEKPTVVPIIIGGGQPQNPADYLGAVKPKRDAKPQGRNPAREYKLYFAA